MFYVTLVVHEFLLKRRELDRDDDDPLPNRE